MYASEMGNVDCLIALLDKADADRADNNGRTAHMCASQSGHGE